MKPKGIKSIELIGDKIFLAVFALIFLAIVALQFVGGGNTVKVGNQDGVAIDQAYEQVIRLAEGKRAQMNMPEVAPDAPKDPPQVTSIVSMALANPTVSQPTQALVEAPQFQIGDSLTPGGDEIDRYAMPSPPAPTQPIAQVYGGALDPYVLEQAPELRESLLGDPNQQPYDLFAVSVQTTFDVEAYRAHLSADPDGSGDLSPMPRQWWQNRQEILDVQVIRREVLPDGERGAEELLPPPPGYASLRDRLSQSLNVGELNQLVRLAETPEYARHIRQPHFYRMISGEEWTPPADAQAGVVDPRAAELAEIRQRISQITSAPPGENPQQLQSLRARETELKDAMALDGVNPETGERTGVNPLLVNPPPRVRDVDGQVTVWAHDMTAVPGATYEYKIRLVLPNPLKGYEQFIAPDLQEIAAPAILTTADSAWSAPVATPESAYMFVERAIVPETGAIGMARPYALVELYRFYYGYWRRGEARVQAGDAISAPIALSAALPLWNIDGAQPTADGEISGSIEANSGRFLLDVVVEPSPAPAGPGGREQMRTAAIIGLADGDVTVRRPGDVADAATQAMLEESSAAAEGARVLAPRPTAAPVSGAGVASGSASR